MIFRILIKYDFSKTEEAVEYMWEESLDRFLALMHRVFGMIAEGKVREVIITIDKDNNSKAS